MNAKKAKGIVTPIAACAPTDRPVAIGVGLCVGMVEFEDVEVGNRDVGVDDVDVDEVIVDMARRPLDCHIIGIPSQSRVKSALMLSVVTFCVGVVVPEGKLSRIQALFNVAPELIALVQP